VESKILLHGRMYITDKFICFYSNFFGFEKKVRSSVRPVGGGCDTIGDAECATALLNRP